MEVVDCDDLDYDFDEACVVFTTEIKALDPWIYGTMLDCVLCPYKKIARLFSGSNTSVVMNSAKPWSLRLFDVPEADDIKLTTDKTGLICELSTNFGQYGSYEVQVDAEECQIITTKQPTNIYTPIVAILAVVISILALISLGRIAIKQWKKRNLVIRSDDNEMKPSKKRIQSIDTFRGISILAMIFVNNGAGGYKVLEHATWNGLYFGDLVFPCFIWIMGVCIPISLTSQLSRGISRLQIIRNIVQRSCLLFFLGVCLNSWGGEAPRLETLRIFGVLQRFGIAYLVAGLTYVLLSPRKSTKFEHGLLASVNDWVSLLPQWIAMLIVLIGHCVLTFKLKVPGCPQGYVGPGGQHDNGQWFNCTGGAAGYVDKLVLGVEHLYQRPTIDSVYGSGAFDPEGILGCMTTVFQTFLGVQAGKTLRLHSTWSSRIVRWLILAVICGALGAFLHFGNVIPVNKNLWSVSFVLVTTSFALVLLTVCYLLVDVTGLWNGGPFRVPGMNALVMYVGHQMCYQIFPFHWKYGVMNTHLSKTVAALWDATLWTIVAYILHRKRTYISL